MQLLLLLLLVGVVMVGLPCVQSLFPLPGSRKGKMNDELYYNPDLTPIINMWVEGSPMQKDEETRIIEERKMERLQDIILRQDMNQQKNKYENTLALQNADIKNLKFMNTFMKNVEGDLKKNSILTSKAFDAKPKFKENNDSSPKQAVVKQKMGNVKEVKEVKKTEVEIEEESKRREEQESLQQTQSDLLNNNMDQGDLMNSLNETDDMSFVQ